MNAGPAAAGTARHVHAATKNRVDAFIGLNYATGYGLTNTNKNNSESITMFVKIECNKEEQKELIQQLKDEGIAYRATTQTTLDETYDESLTDPYTIETLKTTTYYVVFHYSGKLV